jgi:hypothetical protein
MDWPFKILESLPEDLDYELQEIYKRCKTFILPFEHHSSNGSMICEQIWCETAEDQQWIHDNILTFYKIDISRVGELDYEQKESSSRSQSFHKGFCVPHQWSKNSINFTVFRANHGRSKLHHDAAPNMPCKLNIPVINCEAGILYYPKYQRGHNYKNKQPCLMNTTIEHDVLGLEYLSSDRVFLSIGLTDQDNIDKNKILEV